MKFPDQTNDKIIEKPRERTFTLFLTNPIRTKNVEEVRNLDGAILQFISAVTF